MNCDQAQTLLVQRDIEPVPEEQRRLLEQHLASCPRCKQAAQEIREVRRLLDLAPAPALHVDLPDLYRRAADDERRSRRRWRRAALILSAAAAVLLILLALRFEWRWTEGQLIIGWRLPPAAHPNLEESKQPAGVPPEVASELQLLKDLVRALASEVDERDQERQLALASLEQRVDAMTAASQLRWNTMQDSVRALLIAYLESRDQGVRP